MALCGMVNTMLHEKYGWAFGDLRLRRRYAAGLK